MDNKPIRYFARVTAGTEAISWLEMDTLLNVQRIGQTSRTLEFTCVQPPAKLLLLRSVDDVYLYLGTIFGLDRTDPSLVALNKVNTLDFTFALDTCRQVRRIPSAPSYAITASLETPCNYSRFEATAALRQGLDGIVSWRYIDHHDNKAVADLDIRLLIEGNRAMLGLRLGAQPLHRRPYKQASIPGSLKPPVAFGMLMLTNPRLNEALFDPLCGAGTILLEADSNWAPRIIVGSDIDGSAITQAQANARQARSEARFMLADALNMPFPDGSVDRVCSNLPWGRQVELPDPDAFHKRLLAELYRVLRPVGRAVVLTDQVNSFMRALGALPNLHLVLSQQISLYGSHPTILTLIKQARRPDYLHPFIQYHDEDEQMAAVVQTALLSTLGHPEAALRLLAAKTCHRSKDATLRQALSRLVDDPSPQVRDLARSA
ncbi:MAG: methyltransferase domain-containing protein [Chloroflexi bacterium]|nr:methyltransferase domain-containing protein [Chloroflexota bacterium]